MGSKHSYSNDPHSLRDFALMRKIRLRLSELFHVKQSERELDDELRFDLERRIEAIVAAGMGRREAEIAAKREFGSVDLAKEECRDERRTRWLQDLSQDIRFGMRMMRKNLGFTAIAVLTLALGIGANTAIFNVVDTIVIRPLPYRDPEKLLYLLEFRPRAAARSAEVPPSLVDFDRRYSELFSGVSSVSGTRTVLTGVAKPQELQGSIVSPGFFDLLGWYPALGRAFLPGEEKPGAPPVVILSDPFWRHAFGADPSVIGRNVRMNGTATTIVGVMPPGFQNPDGEDHVDVWLPASLGEGHWWVARMNNGVTRTAAEAVLQTSERTLQGHGTGWGIRVLALHEVFSGDIQPDLLILLCCAAFVLLVACTNVANLLLARGAARRHEFNVRSALGASRSRVTRQLLTECVLLGCGGGLAGLALAYWTLKFALTVAPTNFSRLETVHLDGRALLFAGAVSILTALLFGALPAIRLAKVDLASSMKESGSLGKGARQTKTLGILVGAQVGIALLLVVGATLMVRSFLRINPVRPGFDTANKLTVMLPTLDWKTTNPVQREAFLDQVLERVRALPGVRDAAGVDFLPLTGNVRVAKAFANPSAKGVSTNLRVVTPNYFEVMNIPIVGGRQFTEVDDSRTVKVAIVSRMMAERFWPGEDPIGKRFKSEVVNGEITVVGLAADVRTLGTRIISWPEFYVPVRQYPLGRMTLVISTASDPASLAPAVRAGILSVDKDQPLTEVQTLRDIISKSVSYERFYTLLIGSFAAMALVLAAAGIYGVISYSVTQRSREFGIRVALGASSAQVIRSARGATALPVMLGLGAGWAVSLGLSRFMSGVLYGLSPTDMTSNIVAVAILWSVAALASYIPARRALKISPTQALRYE